MIHVLYNPSCRIGNVAEDYVIVCHDQGLGHTSNNVSQTQKALDLRTPRLPLYLFHKNASQTMCHKDNRTEC
jgi:hypothetical protein